MKKTLSRTISERTKAPRAICAALLLTLAGTAVSHASLMDSPSGGTLPDTISPVGGLVIDVVGLNGTRLMTVVEPDMLWGRSGYVSATTTIGVATGFTQSMIDSLGGGIASASFRLSLYDGDNANGNFDYGDNTLYVNGNYIGNFSMVATIETSSSNTLISNPTVISSTTGFTDSKLDTGFFTVSGSASLATLYTALKTGTLTFSVVDGTPDDNNFWFNRPFSASSYNYVGYLPGIDAPTLVLSNTWNTPPTLDYVAKYKTITTENCMIGRLTFAANTSSTLAISGTFTVSSGTISTQSGGSSIISGGYLRGFNGILGVTFDTAADLVVSSVITGDEDVIKTGTATLTLTGANAYTGQTIIKVGNLVVGNNVSGSINATSGITISDSSALIFKMGANAVSTPDIQNNGSVQVVGDNLLTISGTITGTGAFYQNGNGITVLTASNTYTGPTRVNVGTLWIGDGAKGSISSSSALSVGQEGALILAAAPGDSIWSRAIANDGVVVLSGSSASYTYDGTVNGSGNLVKVGNNTVLLNAAQSYTGSTIVAGGILRFGASNLLASQSTLEVNTGASLDMGNYSQGISKVTGGGTILTGSGSVLTVGVNDGSSTFSGVISGSGSLVKTGDGTFTISGQENATGGITIDAGTLVVSGSTNGGININSGAGVLVTGKVSGDVADAGSLVVNGQLDGNVAAAGSLVVNGRLDGNINVTGYLGGSGNIVGDVTNHGVVSPGNSPGVLTISGNYTQTSAGSLLIQIASPTLYDRLDASSVLLDGTLAVTSNNQIRTEYTILTSGSGISGTFSSIAHDSFLKFYLVKNEHSITLEPYYRYLSVAPGLTPNEYAVAKALDKAMDTRVFYENRDLVTLAETLNAMPDASLPAAFEMMVPTDYVILPDATFSLVQVQTSNLELRMEQIRTEYANYNACVNSSRINNNGTHYIDAQGRDVTPVPVDRGWSFFMNGAGDFVSVKPSSTGGDGKYNTGGVSAGADYRWDSIDLPCAAGLTVGYANTSLTGRGDGRDDIDSCNFNGYVTAFKNGYFVNGILGGGMANYDLKRESLGGNARGSASGMNFNASLGGGYSYTANGFSAGPIASLRYTGVQIDSFSERDSLSALDIHEQSKNSFKTTAGFQVAYEFPVETVLIKPHARVQWQHEYANDSRDITASFQTGEEFTVNGESVGSDSLLVDLGATVRFTPMISAYAYYLGDIGANNYTSNAVVGGFQLSF